jgi:hypothetical protein
MRRLDIVDELREFARELEEAKRQGSVKLDQSIATEAKNTQGYNVASPGNQPANREHKPQS